MIYQILKRLLGDGPDLGINYLQRTTSPDGLAQAFIIGEEFIGMMMFVLVLGDNIFYGHGFTEIEAVNTVRRNKKQLVFGIM